VWLQLELPEKPGVSRGKLKVFADSVTATEDVIKFQISAELKSLKILCFGNDNPYLMIERAKQNNHKEFVRTLQT